MKAFWSPVVYVLYFDLKLILSKIPPISPLDLLPALLSGKTGAKSKILMSKDLDPGNEANWSHLISENTMITALKHLNIFSQEYMSTLLKSLPFKHFTASLFQQFHSITFQTFSYSQHHLSSNFTAKLTKEVHSKTFQTFSQPNLTNIFKSTIF